MCYYNIILPIENHTNTLENPFINTLTTISKYIVLPIIATVITSNLFKDSKNKLVYSTISLITPLIIFGIQDSSKKRALLSPLISVLSCHLINDNESQFVSIVFFHFLFESLNTHYINKEIFKNNTLLNKKIAKNQKTKTRTPKDKRFFVMR